MYIARPGDILLFKRHSWIDSGVLFGERLEDGVQPEEYVHVAIALDANWLIEADGKRVSKSSITGRKFTVFRPPIPRSRIDWAIAKVKGYIGQTYDWWIIIDDALRYISRGRFRLPVAFIRSKERYMKVCSSLVVKYFNAAQWGPKLGRNASPEDIYLVVKVYQITNVG